MTICLKKKKMAHLRNLLKSCPLENIDKWKSWLIVKFSSKIANLIKKMQICQILVKSKKQAQKLANLLNLLNNCLAINTGK